ncbi:MAG: glutathione S-transferase family protein [Luteimonas sp.]
MPLILHAHPLSSFCQKVLIALYELDVPFEFRQLDLADPGERAAHLARWPRGKMPVLEDPATGLALPETSIIIEYLDRHHGGGRHLLPADPDAALEVRLWDRISDLYVMLPMQRAVAARIAHGDGETAATARQEVGDELEVAYGLLEARLASRKWLGGDAFTMADCAAMPALFYASAVRAFEPGRPALAAYFRRLLERPSVARVLGEASPWLRHFPLVETLPAGYVPSGYVPAA